jgi:2-octaprenyl-6-methoxyphenol hydroxylase
MGERADIVVVGGGPVGAAFALALGGAGLDIVVLDARRAPAAADARPLALSYGSRLLLERLQAWREMEPAATPIDTIHVSQRGGFGRVALTAAQAAQPALGYVVDYGALAAALAAALGRGSRGARAVAGARAQEVHGDGERARVRYAAGGREYDVEARLVVIADGGGLDRAAPARVTDYRQTAITASVRSALPHRGVAYERFTATGPLALLPSREQWALVWTTAPDHAQALRDADDASFLSQLQRHFGDRHGAFTAAGARSIHPLRLRRAASAAQPRTVLIGNAAQTLHPVAGQGFNLGLRDAWELADIVARTAPAQLGSAAMLSAFHARRRIDRGGGVLFTDSLVRLFSNDLPPLALARGAGLALLGCLPPLRDFVVRRMTFGARG